jgi:thioesterase domain-containing protein
MHTAELLFARALRNSEQVVLPVNETARRGDLNLPGIYCVHSVSGTAGTTFLDLAQRLDPTVRFYGIQAPPKLMNDAEFGATIESIADHYLDALAKFQPDGPIVLGGYCLGAIIALEMAKKLRAGGREVGPLLAIDGAPVAGGTLLDRLDLQYWLELARNFPGWIMHLDLMRNRNIRSLIRGLSKNVLEIGKGAIGLKRGEKLGGGYAMDSMMDLSNYPPLHRLFINRLFNALFAYVPEIYSGDVVSYEAKITPFLYLPQLGRAWTALASKTEVIGIAGTHISMMHAEPYIDALANDMRRRIVEFYSKTRG